MANTTKTYWDALCNGQTGVGPITKFDASDFRVRFAAEVKDFDPSRYGVDRRSARRMDLFTQYAIAAAVQAVENAGLDLGAARADRVGVVFGSGIGGIRTFEDQHDAYRNGGPRRISPLFVPMMIPDMSAGQVSIHLGAKGPNYTIVTACASAAHAIGNAAREIWDDEADVMITGGGRSRHYPRWPWGGLPRRERFQRATTRQNAPAGPLTRTAMGLSLARARAVWSWKNSGAQNSAGLQSTRSGGRGVYRRRASHHGYGARRRGRRARPQTRYAPSAGQSGECVLYQRARHLHARGRSGRNRGHQSRFWGPCEKKSPSVPQSP